MVGTGAARGAGGGATGAVTVSAAAELAAHGTAFWPRLAGHPFVVAAADGSLPDGALAWWLAQGHLFLAAYRRFHAGLLALTPDEEAGDLLSRAVASMRPELAQFYTFAKARGMSMDADAEPATLALTTFLGASLRSGYPVGLAVLYGTETSYRSAWTAVRDVAREHSPIWPFIDNWSSPASGSWVEDVARLVNAAAPLGATAPMCRAFEYAVRSELRLFDAIHTGERW